jgi:hypothetical protein
MPVNDRTRRTGLVDNRNACCLAADVLKTGCEAPGKERVRMVYLVM